MTISKPTSTRRRTIYTFAPLLLLIACLVSINFVNWWTQQAAPISKTGLETAVTTPITNETIANQPTIPPTATADSSPALTTTPSAIPYNPPTFPPDTRIVLLGPPGDAAFSSKQPPVLYWQWPLPLDEDQFFVVHLFIEGTEVEIGTINEPNLGLYYQWQVNPEAIPTSAETVGWQIQLFSQQSDTPLLMSEIRSLSLR